MIKLIAETAWHHEGDFTFMEDLVKQICKETSSNIVKLHISLDLDEYMAKDHEAYKILKSWMFSEQQWSSLINIVKESDKELMLLVNDTKAVKFAANHNPDYVELHSVCLNVPRLQKAVLNNFNLQTKFVIGVGGCTLDEVDMAINVFSNRDVILMFGFQNYPTKYEDINLSKIVKIQSLYRDKSFGYADHTAWDNENNEIITSLIAANGMKYVEKHVTTAFGLKRCDYSAAISIEMLNSLSSKLSILNKVTGDGILSLSDAEKDYSIYGPMKMAAVLNRNVEEGEVLTEKLFDFKRTNYISDIGQVDIVQNIGKLKFIKPLKKDSIISRDAVLDIREKK